MKCEECQGTGEVKEKPVNDGKHKDSQGNFFSCCNPKLKKPYLRYSLHAEHMLKMHGISFQEYDRIHNSNEDFP